MDANIYKNIINSDNEIEISPSLESQVVAEHFPALNKSLINRLSKQFTRLLSYKVSQEAHQRYSVRLNVIEILRDWSRVRGNCGKLAILYDLNISSNILIMILKKYMTPELLTTCNYMKNLIFIAEILIITVAKNKSMMKHLIIVIEKIISSEQTQESQQFLDMIIEKSSDLKFDSWILEKIYFTQRHRLIDKPFKACFVAFCSDQNEHLNKMNLLFEKIVDSPSLFQFVSNQLKDTFIATDYAAEAQNFIKMVLHKIQIHCDKYNKDTLDLYPTNVQFCVILLRIEPCYHTESSRKQAVNSLNQIFLRNRNDAMILISHFPQWLPDFLEFFEDFNQLSQDSSTQNYGNINIESSKI